MSQLRLGWWWVLCLVALLAAGIHHLLALRFAAGDVYPPYSSLRADPLGTKALHDSLQSLPGLVIGRNYEPLPRLAQSSPQTVLITGVTPGRLFWLQLSAAEQLEKLPANGDRVVLTLLPITDPKPAAPANTTDRADQSAPPEDEEQQQREEMTSFTNRWGFTIGYLPSSQQLPTNGPWRTRAYFKPLDPGWKVLERFRGNPVMLERSFRTGSLVLCADSYFLSNEGLRVDRRTDLVAALVGPHRRIVFEETHHGVREQPGVMSLARRYRLHGFFAGLVLLAGLYIWKNALPFVPPETDTVAERQAAAGRHAAAGFVNLLRRSIPMSDLLGVCFAEWKKSCAHRYRRQPAKLAQAEAVLAQHNALPPRQRNPLASYQAIAKILHQRRTP